MEIYKTFIDIDEHRLLQMVICLPQSKIGYTYPEIYLCAPKRGTKELTYIKFDVVLGAAWKTDDKTFIPLYMKGEELTEEKFKELNIFKCDLKTIAEAFYEAMQ